MFHLVLADDSKTIQKVVSLSFAGEECELFCFENGASALEHVRRRGADIVLADVSLPVLDGYELCRELKEDPRTAKLPVVLLASAFEPFDSFRAEALRHDGSLTKPFETSQLVGMVKDLVAETERQREQERAALEKNHSPAEGGVLQLKVPESTGSPLFDLNVGDCHPSFRELDGRTILAGGKFVDGLSEQQFNALLGEVSRRLPMALRELLPQLTKRTSGD